MEIEKAKAAAGKKESADEKSCKPTASVAVYSFFWRSFPGGTMRLGHD